MLHVTCSVFDKVYSKSDLIYDYSLSQSKYHLPITTNVFPLDLFTSRQLKFLSPFAFDLPFNWKFYNVL
jgi:hypothetical protein